MAWRDRKGAKTAGAERGGGIRALASSPPPSAAARARAAALLPRSLSLTLTDLQALQCKGKWCWHLLRNVGYIHGNNSLKCMSLLDY